MKTIVNFIDAQEMAKQYPKTFTAPSLKELQEIQIGHFVKVCVEKERFWCKVLDISDLDNLLCQIDNDLVFTKVHKLKCGDILVIQTRFIYAIWVAP